MAELDYRTITDKLEQKMKRIGKLHYILQSGSSRDPEGPSAAHGFTSAYTCFRGVDFLVLDVTGCDWI